MRSTMLSAAALVGTLTTACSAGRVAPFTTLPMDSVSVGYGRLPRASATASVAVLTEKEMNGTRVARVEELLEGRVAGVQMMRTAGGRLSIRIRGAHSFLGSDEPLFVVDGMPLPPGPTPGTALLGIVPQDVARIEVLKDASATAIYGMRGANGVVVITTKRSR